jgi:hypothetical protein
MPAVRPEFGPTLPELLAPRVRALPRAAQAALAVLAAVVAAGAVYAVVHMREIDERPQAVVRSPIAYNLLYASPLERVAPRGRETLRLQTPAGAAAPQSFSVTPYKLPPYKGDATGILTLQSANMITQMRRTIPGFVWRGDGRVNYNRQPGYEILYQAKIDGRTTYGRRTILLPGGDTPPREGVDIRMVAARSDSIPRVDAVGATNGSALKTAIRSFRFGTERP